MMTVSSSSWVVGLSLWWALFAYGQCCSHVNSHSYCGTSSCPPEDRLVSNPSDYCRTFSQFQAAHIFPDEWELLFDSDDYRQSNILGSVFLEREFDSDDSTLRERDRTWIQQGGECQRQFRVCAWSQGPQDNWLFSKHIKYPPGSTTAGGDYSTEVYLNITYRFSSCNPFAGCTNNFVTLYRYDTDGIVLEAERTKKTNYALLFGQGTENTDSRFQQIIDDFNDDNVLRSFTTSGSTGFHLGIRDTGTCGYVDRIILYYTPCKKFQDGLVSYPELVRPPEGSPPNVAQACCTPNSHNTTSLNFRAYSVSDGRCERDVMCECDAGYILNTNGMGCDPCAAGLYRSKNDRHDGDCLACPENTVRDAVGATICGCAENYFRYDGEGPEIGCTSPPIRPGPPNCTIITATLIQIEWNPPSDQGGRTDTFYNVEYQAVCSKDGYTTRGPIYSTSYLITGLEPVTQYRIRVVAENYVSHKDTRPGIKTTRTSPVVLCKTVEGKPSAPSNVQIVENSVFLWQPPLNPNGQITGYRIGLSYNSSTGAYKNLPPVELDAASFYYVLRRGVVPDNVVVVYITVTAKTSAGYGEASDSIVFEPFASTSTLVEMCPQVMEVKFTLGNQTYQSNSTIKMSDIGEGDNALYCWTSNTECCADQHNIIGEFYYPDCGRVSNKEASREGMYVSRGEQYIRLNRRSGATPPLGRYKCEVPFSSELSQTTYISVIADLVSCPPLAPPIDGDVTVRGNVANYSCNPDYALVNGSSNRTCQPNGKWNGSAPICKAILCPPLKNPAHGMVNVVSNRAGVGIAWYTCSPGYKRVGEPFRECLSDGQWSFKVPYCEMVQCQALPNPGNGKVIARGNVANYSCNHGYTLVGSPNRTCQLNETWSGIAPTCQGGGMGGACGQGYFSGVVNASVVLATGFYLREHLYANGTSISVTRIGEGNAAALIFKTDNPNCCKSQRLGECYYPNGALVGIRKAGDELYRSRGQQLVRLNRQFSFANYQAPAGLYCCSVPDKNQKLTNICVNITVRS